MKMGPVRPLPSVHSRKGGAGTCGGGGGGGKNGKPGDDDGGKEDDEEENPNLDCTSAGGLALNAASPDAMQKA
jgi:hypothetical protein